MQLTKFPPWPVDPLPGLDVLSDGTPGNYFFDDRDVDYSALWAAQAAQPEAASSGLITGGATTQSAVPTPPGGGGAGGTNGGVPLFRSFQPPGSGYVSCETWTNFWL